MLRLWHFYENLRSSLSRSRLGKALDQKYLSLQRHREWSDIVRQLKEMLATAGFRVGSPHIELPPIDVERPRGSDGGDSESVAVDVRGARGGGTNQPRDKGRNRSGRGQDPRSQNNRGQSNRSESNRSESNRSQRPGQGVDRRVGHSDVVDGDDRPEAEGESGGGGTGQGSAGGRGASGQPPRGRTRPLGYDAIHQSLLTGLLSGVASLGDNRQYQGAGGLTFALWPGSGLFQRTPKWIMVAEVLETTRRYGRTVAEIDVAWVEKLAQPLLKHSYNDPHWSRKGQSAMVYQRSTLYGLTIVDRRQVPLAPIDASLARQFLITHALALGESQCREKFLLHNQQTLAELQALAERSRRRDLLVDPYAIEQFYLQRLPEAVVDLPSLRKWLSSHAGTPSEQALWMKPEDILGHAVDEPPEEYFPDQLRIGATKLPLSYRFHPGDETDGVTVTVPQIALRQVSQECLDGWSRVCWKTSCST